MRSESKKVLIISDGPVPSPEHKKVEGGGLRSWGLAKGLSANNSETEVTTAYHSRFRTEAFTQKFEGINIDTYDTEDDILALIKQFDTVIVSFAMGNLSLVVSRNIGTNQQLILDCNMPAYVEVSARNSKDVDEEFRNFNIDVDRFAEVLRRGDLFLCASEAQKQYYIGVLSAVGRINPLTYGQELIEIVPYGIYREEPKATHTPISDMVQSSGVKKILWFGGIYPWFDLSVLIDAIKVANKTVPMNLIIVGAKNPFNGHPDFLRKYDELIEYIDSSDMQDLVKVEDWVDFNDRANWYLDSDAVVTINKVGMENSLSWRTRLVDYVWSNIPILTNGGDPLGEYLLENNAAIRLPELTSKSIAAELISLFTTKSKLGSIKNQLADVKKTLYWDVVTKDLSNAINSGFRAKDIRAYGHYQGIASEHQTRRGKVRSIVSKAKQLPAYARKHGKKNTYHVLRSMAARRLRRYTGKVTSKAEPKIVVISHQLDISGAPFVIIDVVREIKEKAPEQNIEFYTYNPAHDDQIKALNAIGIKPHIFMSRDAVPLFNKGDTLIINTIAHSGIVKNALYDNLENGTLKKLVWYIHEDNPEYLFTNEEKVRIKNLINKNKIVLFTAATRTKKHYDDFFETDKVRIQNYRVITPQKYHKVREASDFNKIDFLLTGVAADGRKGQLTIFYAFTYFLKEYYEKNKNNYRDFSLNYVGLGPDLVSQQLKNHANKALGNRFKSYPVSSKEKTMDITLKSNFTICYSLLECLPLFVFEGMIAGHPIFRNDCSGIEEQLEDGKNGMYLETKDFWQVVSVIEETLNKKKTSNELLSNMSKRSYEISKAQELKSYLPMIEEVLQKRG